MMRRAAFSTDVERAERALLNAPFETDGWRRAVVAVAEATRSGSAHLLGYGGPLTFPLNISAGHVEDHLDILAEPTLYDETNWRVHTTRDPMSIQRESDYAAYRASRPTASYDDCVSDMDVPFGCQSAVIIDSKSFIGMCLLRRRRDGVCTPETIAIFSRLRLKLRRAIDVQIALDGQAAEAMLEGVGQASCATFLLDRHGAVVAASPAADAMVGEGRLFRGGVLGLGLHDPADDAALQSTLARLYRADMRACDWLAAGIHAGGGYKIAIARLPEGETGLGFAPFAAVTVKNA